MSSIDRAENGLRGLGISMTDSGETIESLAGISEYICCFVVVDGGEIALGVSSFFVGALALTLG